MKGYENNIYVVDDEVVYSNPVEIDDNWKNHDFEGKNVEAGKVNTKAEENSDNETVPTLRGRKKTLKWVFHMLFSLILVVCCTVTIFTLVRMYDLIDDLQDQVDSQVKIDESLRSELDFYNKEITSEISELQAGVNTSNKQFVKKTQSLEAKLNSETLWRKALSRDANKGYRQNADKIQDLKSVLGHVETGKELCCGHFSNRQGWSGGTCERDVTFNDPYKTKPRVILTIEMMDVAHNKNLRFNLVLKDTTTTGFTAVCSKWGDTYIHGMRFTWTSFPYFPNIL